MEKFQNLGYDPELDHKESHFSLALSFLVRNSIALSLIIFVLTFTALTVISRIKDLCWAGIHLISGEIIRSIMFQSVRSDLLVISFSFAFFSFVGWSIFSALDYSQMGLWRSFTAALLVYFLMLMLVSVFFSVIYIMGLKKSGLMSIIKGKLPVGKLIAVILMCQLFAVIAVGWGFGLSSSLLSKFQGRTKS